MWACVVDAFHLIFCKAWRNLQLLSEKGAWMKEDDLLRNCIEKYGEGKWHLVPQRAGLKRCRKSCRLRWLNYLKPTIKRGGFQADEVDLIIRLHRLLGNRWSLIDGRLPGRTPNDVKNFWHTHLRKLLITGDQDHSLRRITKGPDNLQNQVTIKPQPTTLSSKHLPLETVTASCEGENCLNTAMDFATNSSSSLSTPENWTECLTSLMEFEDKGENDKTTSTCFVNLQHAVDRVNDFWYEEIDQDISFKDLSCWNDMFFDVNA